MLKKVNIVKFNAEQIQNIHQQIDEVKNAFPHLETIDPLERRKNQNIRLGGFGFVRRTQVVSRSKSELSNGFVNPDNFDDALVSYDQEKAIYDQISAFQQNLGDDLILKGQYLMAQANEVYAAVKRAAKRDPQYQALLDELSVFYKRSKGKKATMTTDKQTNNG